MKKPIVIRSIGDFRSSYFHMRRSEDKVWYGWQVMEPNRMLSLLEAYRKKENDDIMREKAFKIMEQLTATN